MKCRICGLEMAHPVYRAREMMFGTREEFDYFQCGACGCLQITDIPNNLGHYYPPEYYSFNTTTPISVASAVTKFLQKQRIRNALFGRGHKLNRILSPIVSLPLELFTVGPVIRRAGISNFSSPMLDVGCGSRSWWLSSLKRLGFSNLLGIDPFIEGNMMFDGIPILKKTISEVSGRFSLITLHHSFEHIPDPYATLHSLASLLEPGGVCLLRIPVVSSYMWEKYGVNWVELDAPRHLFLHSIKSIEILAAKVGLNLFETIYDSTLFEFLGSEQYTRDIPLLAENSHFVNPDKSIFTPKDIEYFLKEVDRVNKERCGGRAGFYLRSEHKPS